MIRNCILSKFVKSLGKGSFGDVDLFHHVKSDGTHFHTAIKTSDCSDYESLEKEFEILSKLKGCPGIVRCYDESLVETVDQYGQKKYKMSLEYASEGSLSSFMEKQGGILPDQEIREITRMILQGLVSVHSFGYVHCDLKPDNILVFPTPGSSSYEIKLADFGLSRELGEGKGWWSLLSPFWATPTYMSPESVGKGTIVQALDIWSLGCIVLKMYTGNSAWDEEDEDEIFDALTDGHAPEIPMSLPTAAKNFLEICFARKPADRGSASTLLKHPFLCGEEAKPIQNTDKITVAAEAVEDVKTAEPMEKSPTELEGKSSSFPLKSRKLRLFLPSPQVSRLLRTDPAS